jgi:hypothetical protein
VEQEEEVHNISPFGRGMAEYTAEELGLGGRFIDFDAESYNKLIRAIHKFPDDRAGTYTAEEYAPHVKKILDILEPLSPEQRDLLMMTPDGETDGRLPYVKAYLMNKIVLMYIFLNFIITNKKAVFNTLDHYRYNFADYAAKRKDHKLLLWIKSHGGRLGFFAPRGAIVTNEVMNTNIHSNEADLAHVIFNNDDYKKIIRLLQKETPQGAIRGFHGPTIALRRPATLPMTSKKLRVYNNKKYGIRTVRKNMHAGRKNIIMQADLSTLDEWAKQQQEYITETHRRRYIVNSYTHHGDVIVNTYLRGKLFEDFSNNGETVYIMNEHVRNILSNITESHRSTLPFIYQVFDLYDEIFIGGADINGVEYPLKEEFGTGDEITQMSDFQKFCKYYMNTLMERHILEKLLEDYADELNEIIRNAPRLPHSIQSYRGSTSEYHIPKGIREYTHSGFTSTSLNPGVAFHFARMIYPTVKCCIYELSIPVSTPVIYLESVTEHKKEYEILMPLDVRVQASDKLLLKRMYGREDRVIVREVTVKGIYRGSPSTHTRSMRKYRVKKRRIVTQKNKVPAGGAGRGSP